MKPPSDAEQLAAMLAKYEGKERRLSARLEDMDIDKVSKKDVIYLGGKLYSDAFDRSQGVILDDDLVGITRQVLNQHLLIVGASGSGKTTILERIVQQVLSATGLDIFFIDGKGEEKLALEFATLVKRYRHMQTPIFRVEGVKQGALYNPFVGSPSAIFNRLCVFAGVSEQTGDSQYYADRNIDILQLVAFAPPDAPRTFAQVMERLNREWLITAYKSKPEVLRDLAGMDKEAFTQLAVRLRPLARMFGELTGREGFTIEDARHAVFSLNTSGGETTTRKLINMLIADIKDAMTRRMKRPSLWIIDEFLVLGNETIRDILTVGRSMGVHVILAMQSVDAIEDKKTLEAILTNCSTKIIMGQDRPETLVQLGGTRKVWEQSAQIEEGAATGAGSARLQDQFLIDPNEVRGLNTGECFLLRRQKAAKIKVSRISKLKIDPSAELEIKREEPLTPPQAADVPEI